MLGIQAKDPRNNTYLAIGGMGVAGAVLLTGLFFAMAYGGPKTILGIPYSFVPSWGAVGKLHSTMTGLKIMLPILLVGGVVTIVQFEVLLHAIDREQKEPSAAMERARILNSDFEVYKEPPPWNSKS